jgi:hypothetical protein
MYRSWASGLVGVWNLIGTNKRVYDSGRAWQLDSSPSKKMEKNHTFVWHILSFFNKNWEFFGFFKSVDLTNFAMYQDYMCTKMFMCI